MRIKYDIPIVMFYLEGSFISELAVDMKQGYFSEIFIVVVERKGEDV